MRPPRRKNIVFLTSILLVGLISLSANEVVSMENTVQSYVSNLSQGLVVGSNNSTMKEEIVNLSSETNSQVNSNSSSLTTREEKSKEVAKTISIDTIGILIGSLATFGLLIYTGLEYYRKKRNDPKKSLIPHSVPFHFLITNFSPSQSYSICSHQNPPISKFSSDYYSVL